VTSEYWTHYGNNILPQWGAAYPHHSGEEIATWLSRQLQLDPNVNMDMVLRGSNFLYTGADGSSDFGGSFEAYPTTYDYDTSLTEAGDLTDKYFKVNTIPVKDSVKKAYGSMIENVVKSDDRKTLEDLDCPYGYVLYETNTTFGGSLSAYIFDHGVFSVNHPNPSAHSFHSKAMTATVRTGDPGGGPREANHNWRDVCEEMEAIPDPTSVVQI
jgi:hypothetical protein